MAAFSYQNHHQSLFLDPAYIPPTYNSTINVAPAPHQPGDLTNVSSSCTSPIFFNCYYSPDQPITEVSDNDLMTTHDSSSSLDIANQVVVGEEVQTKHNDCSVEKKRKNSKQMVVSSSNPALFNDLKEGKRRKQKKYSNGVMKNADEEKQQQRPPPPTGYIHVRARRGQATDSHSLAERVRREKISERMKLLQGLVPGCEKVIGKALMLDEIINYVQSLQHQVEFLSMKLASVSPTLLEFGFDLDDHYFVQPQKVDSMSAPVPSVEQTGHIQPTVFVESTGNYCSMVDSSASFLLNGHGPTTTAFSQEQGNLAAAHHVVDFHQFQLNNIMGSFQ